ncbi:MAG: diguanylate cyclase [Rhodobacterales bacterium]|nr:diguanylate cyclase [Rhodobacterales bacterium]
MNLPARVLAVSALGESTSCARVIAAIRVDDSSARVQPAQGITAAEDFLRDRVYDCVLLTEGAVAGDWKEAIRRLHEVAPNCSVIAVVEGDRPVGTHDFLDPWKPEPANVGRVVRYAVDHSRAQVALQAATDQMARWALEDPLSGCLNRRGIEQVLVKLAAAQERGTGGAVALLLDCDDFKSVNDGYGHAAGDAVLKAIAHSLLDTVRAGDYVARVGGDEFLVVLPDTRTWEALEVAERIRRRVIDAVRNLPDEVPEVSVSIGVQRLTIGIISVTEVVRATQSALHESKEGGKNRVTMRGNVNTPAAPPRTGTPLFGERREEYLVNRVCCLETGQLCAWEVRSASATGEAEELYRHAVKRAALPNVDLAWFRAAARRLPLGNIPCYITIFPATLLQMSGEILDRLPPGVTSDRLRLCLDEQFLSGDPWALRPPLALLRAHEVGLCIDISDFGRTTLESMILLRPDVVRIDRQRVSGVASSVAMRSGLQRFIRVCEGLSVQVIASGLVHGDDVAVLQDLGISFGVGPAVKDLADC